MAQHTARFKPRAEVGLLGVWMTCNYGAVLTSFALYRLLEQMGKSVSLIDFSFTERQKDPATVFRNFWSGSAFPQRRCTPWTTPTT